MTAYIDNNVLVDIEENKSSVKDLFEKVDNKITAFFYSPAHLQEAREMKGDFIERQQKLKRRFEIISEITSNNYLYQEYPSNVIKKIIQEPHVGYQTINDVPGTQSQMKTMVNIVSEAQREMVRKQLHIDPLVLNNYTPRALFETLNKRTDVFGNMTATGMINYAIKMQGGNMGIYGKITAIFELLDLVGYWKDRYSEKSNYARLWDSNHASYSTNFDYFISNDKKTRRKAAAAFYLCGFETKIISATGEF